MQRVSRHRLYSFVCVLLGTVAFTGKLAAETYEYDSDDGHMHIWDVSGTYDVALFDSIYVSFTLTQDSRGKLGGSGTTSGTYGEHGVHYGYGLTYTITGSVRQSAGVAYIRMTLRLKGTVSDGDDAYKFKATITITADVHSAVLLLAGTIRGSGSIGGKSIRQEGAFEGDLPLDMDGSFKLVVNIEPDGRKVTGDGLLTLSNGNAYAFSGKGTLNARTDTYSLTLSSTNRAEKNSLRLNINRGNPGDFPSKFSGMVLGQRLKG